MAKEKQKTILPSAARTADSNTQFTHSGTGGKVIIDCTVDPAAASVVFTLQGIDPISGSTWTILQSAAVAAVGTTVLTVFPGAPATANVSANDFLPENIQINANHADGDSITYSVSFIGI